MKRVGVGRLMTRVSSRAAGDEAGQVGEARAVAVVVQDAGARRTLQPRQVQPGEDGKRRRAAGDEARHRQPLLLQPSPQLQHRLEQCRHARPGARRSSPDGCGRRRRAGRRAAGRAAGRSARTARRPRPRGDAGAVLAHVQVEQHVHASAPRRASALRQAPAPRRDGRRGTENRQPGYVATSRASRSQLGPTRLYASSTSAAPQPASISASAMVAHLCLVMPASSSMRTISRVLCVLTCGRSRPGLAGHLDGTGDVLADQRLVEHQAGAEDGGGIADGVERVHEKQNPRRWDCGEQQGLEAQYTPGKLPGRCFRRILGVMAPRWTELQRK